MRGLMGTFAMMPLQELVEFLARRKATGILTCERGTIRKSISMADGIAVGSSSNDPREHLGQLLLNFGHLTEEQLARAFEAQQETKVRLGKVLAMVGVVSPDVIHDTLTLQIRETLLDAYVWDSGLFRVDDDPPAAVDELDARVSLDDIAREAEFRQTAWRAFRAQFPTGTAALRVTEASVPHDLPLGGIDDRLLALAREGKTIDEIGLALHATDFHLYQRLYALQRLGVIEAVPMSVPLQAPSEADGMEAPDAAAVQRLRAVFLDVPRKPRLKLSSQDLALMRLSAAEKYLLGRCDGGRDLRQILQLAPLPELDVLRAMQRFVDARIVELG